MNRGAENALSGFQISMLIILNFISCPYPKIACYCGHKVNDSIEESRYTKDYENVKLVDRPSCWAA